MTAATTTVRTPLLTAATRRRLITRNAWTVAVYVVLLLMIGYEKIIHPAYGSFEIQSLVVGALPLVFAAMAQTCAVLVGGIDLAIGPLMSVVNVTAATYMLNRDVKGALLVAGLIIIAMALAGALTGAVITLTGVPDIIVTLATSFVWGGIALEIMGTPGSGGAPTPLTNIAVNEVFTWIPEALFVLVGALLVIWLPFYRSRLGLQVYAVGSNRAAAYLSGVGVRFPKIIAYALGGVFTALAGFIITASAGGTGDPHAGDVYTLQSVAAVVLGGVSLAGGRGGMLGPIAAAFILFNTGTVLTYLGVDQNWSTVYQGAIVVLVVAVAGFLAIRKRI